MKKIHHDDQPLKDCPICQNGRFLNRLSKESFFCISCLNEFKAYKDRTYLIEINPENGNIIPVLI